ncbi:MAG: amino acid adenylation domain-containing protein, partial [bacterium]|nr:amino acid adenylation domain-containing protein [bacterium]
HTLRQKGLQPGDIAGILMENTSELITAILSTLAAGAAYMPISTDFPAQRIDYMLKDSNAKILLAGEENKAAKIKEETTGTINCEILYPTQLTLANYDADDRENSDGIKNGDDEKLRRVGPLDPVYVIYTSGTTGQPKGVMIQNRNLVNYISWFTGESAITSEDRAILTTSFAFDLGYSTIYPPLLKGGQLHIPPEEDYLNPGKLLEYIKNNDITYLKMTPSLFSTLVNEPGFPGVKSKKLRLAVLGGEPVNTSDIEKAYRYHKTLKIMDEYGPTEATIGCIAGFVDIHRFDDYLENPTIGKPISNTAVYILDKNLKPVPLGVAGELILSGDSIAAGYVNRPELTSEKFLNYDKIDTYTALTITQYPITDNYFYRTGDLARWLPDGNIQYLDRIDSQVKIRGFRIELGEIENRLLANDTIKEAIVVTQKDKENTNYLAAYYVLNGATGETQHEIDEQQHRKVLSQLRTNLSETLPDYMIPSYFVPLQRLPLTPNGKIDIKALPETGEAARVSSEYHAPANEREEKLVQIWQEVLTRKKIGIYDNFFEVGGHSLKATVLAAAIYKEMNIKISLLHVFKYPSVRALSDYIAETKKEEYLAVEPVEKREYYELSPTQKRFYSIYRKQPANTAYNMPFVVVPEKTVTKEKLAETVNKLTARHESLRTTFGIVEGIPVQRIEEKTAIEIEDKKANLATLPGIINRFVRPFDLAGAPLLRVLVIEIPGGVRIWVSDMHHIISDGVSQTVLMTDFNKLYTGRELAPLSLQYRDYAAWRNHQIKSGQLEAQMNYWLHRFDDLTEIPRLQLPTDYPRPEVFTYEGSGYEFTLEKEGADRFKEVGAENGATLYMKILAVLNVLFYKYTAAEDIVIGTTIANRPHADLQGIIGLFINALLMRNQPHGKKRF